LKASSAKQGEGAVREMAGEIEETEAQVLPRYYSS